MYAAEPLAVLALPLLVLGVLILLLRWTWSRSRHSVAGRRSRRGAPGDYGLLVGVATPADAAEARRMSARLRAAGIRHTVANTTQGPRLMVFESDAERSREALGRVGPGDA
jgi:FtsP/CotA-like multicopper oxidase with cupredoxin domain